MRNILLGSVSRGPFYMADIGAGNGGGPSGWNPFRRTAKQTAPQNNNNTNNNNTNNNNNNNTNNNGTGDDDNNDSDNPDDGDGLETFLANNKELWQDDDEGNEISAEDESRREAAENKRKESLANYIKSQQFGLKVDITKLKDAIDTNNPEYINNIFNEALQRVFAQSLHDVTRMMTASESKIRDMVGNISQNQLSARESELSLMMALPAAKNPAVKPVAMAFKSRFMKKGQSDDEANESVVKMFKYFRSAPAEMFGLDEDDIDDVTVPASRRGRVTKDKKTGVKLIQGEPDDWGAFLSGR